MSPICTLVWHNLRLSWMQPLFKHSETRKKEKEPKRKNNPVFKEWGKKSYKFSNLKIYLLCYVKPEASYISHVLHHCYANMLLYFWLQWLIGDRDSHCGVICSRTQGKPVCGSDGRSYETGCELQRARCQDKTLTLAHRGRCRGEDWTLLTVYVRHAMKIFLMIWSHRIIVI